MTYKPDIYIHNDDNSARFVLGNSIANPLIVIGINPSTADDITSDTTIRRVSGYAQINKFNGFIMLNVYPQRATNPNNLPKECDICLHKQNIAQIKKIFQTYSGATILVAFGNLIRKRIYLKQCFSDIVKEVLKYNPQWKQIGNPTAKGNPRHPSRGTYQELKDLDILKYINDPI